METYTSSLIILAVIGFIGGAIIMWRNRHHSQWASMYTNTVENEIRFIFGILLAVASTTVMASEVARTVDENIAMTIYFIGAAITAGIGYILYTWINKEF